MKAPPRRVLMVAYYFPPLGGIGSIRAMKFARYLPEWGWNPTILAPAGSPQRRDDSLVFDETKVIRARAFEIGQLGQSIVVGGSVEEPSGPGASIRGSLRRFAHRYL